MDGAAALAIWFAVLLVVIFQRHLAIPRRILTSDPANLLGRISYPIYLSHVIIFYAALYVMAAYRPATTQSEALVGLTALIALVLAFSLALHEWVEKPGMRLGSMLALKHAAPEPQS